MTCDRSSGARAGRPLTAQTGEDSNGTFGEYCSGIHNAALAVQSNLAKHFSSSSCCDAPVLVADLSPWGVSMTSARRCSPVELIAGERCNNARVLLPNLFSLNITAGPGVACSIVDPPGDPAASSQTTAGASHQPVGGAERVGASGADAAHGVGGAGASGSAVRAGGRDRQAAPALLITRRCSR